MNGQGPLSSSSGRSQHHLTGEMIRKIRENSAASQIQQRMLQAAQQAQLAQHFQQQNLQAVYERALKEKTYLRPTSNSKASTTYTSNDDRSFAKPATITAPPPQPQQQQQLQAALTAAVAAATATITTSQAAAPPNVSSTAHILSGPKDDGGVESVKLQETKIAGRSIACFFIGGEARCCLPQILNSILDQISLPAIHLSCDQLQINCSTCTMDQMEVLKSAKIIPISAPQCGLITKSDAERLVSMLLDRNPPLASLTGFRAKSSPFSFKVEHHCLGYCQGIVLPEAYTKPGAECIECLECGGLFSPQKFVCHSHSPQNRICHWGFDSANWRHYIQLSEDYTDAEQDKLEKFMADFKARFKPQPPVMPQQLKRKGHDGYSTSYGGSSEALSPPPPLAPLPSSSGSSSTAVSGSLVNNKKPRLSSSGSEGPGGPGSEGPASDRDYPYLFQSWLKMNPQIAQQGLHPQAISALFSQALKEGKVSLGNGHSSSSRSDPHHQKPRGSSLDRHTSLSSSATSSSSSQQLLHNGGRSLSAERGVVRTSSTGQRQVPPSTSYTPQSKGGVQGFSPTEHKGVDLMDVDCVDKRGVLNRQSSTVSSLPEDVKSIQSALEGASREAKDATLKVLSKLIQRLEQAELDRDNAISEMRETSKRCKYLENELDKKRAELRELLIQDSNSQQNNSPDHQGAGSESQRRMKRHLPPSAGYEDPPQQQQQQQPGESQLELTTRRSSGYHGGHGPEDGPEMEPMDPGGGGGSAPPPTDLTLVKRDHHQPQPMQQPADVARGEGVVEEEDYPPFPKRHRALVKQQDESHEGSSGLGIKSESDSKPPVVKAENYSSNNDSQVNMALARRASSGTPVSIKSKESEDLRDRMMTMEAELRSLREELSHRGGGSSASAASSLESDTNKAAVTSQQSNANPGSATVKVTAGVNSKTVTAAVENIVSKKKMAAAAAAAAARQSLDSQQLSNCQTSVSKEVVTAGKLGSNGEVSTGSSEEDDSLEGDDSGHLAGPEKRLSLQDDDMPGGALTAADSKTAVKRAELTVVENTDGNAEIDDDEEEIEDSLIKTPVKSAKEVSKSIVMDDKTGKLSSKRDDQKTK